MGPRADPSRRPPRRASTVSISTPFAVGRVNIYLIEDQPLTLVDTGPNSGTSLDELHRGLAALGHRLQDLDLVIITHQHIDHRGLVRIVASNSGADVAAIEAAVPFVEKGLGGERRGDPSATRRGANRAAGPRARGSLPARPLDELREIKRAFEGHTSHS